MRSVLIFIYVFFISATAQTALSAISGDILYDDLNRVYVWNTPEQFTTDCRNTPFNTIDDHSAAENDYLFDDCEFSTQPEPALWTHGRGGTKGLDFFNLNWTKLSSSVYRPMYAGADIFNSDNGSDDILANNPGPGDNFYNQVVAWIKDVYHGWVAKDNYGSTRLLLLSFGLVGIVGVRRKFKKN